MSEQLPDVELVIIRKVEEYKQMSSPPLRVFLNSEEERTLWELRRGKNIPQRTKDRAETVRLSAQGWRVEKISHYLKCSPSTGLLKELNPDINKIAMK